jgi:putative phage-type endonuclease
MNMETSVVGVSDTLIELIDGYLQEHYSIISNPDFETILISDIKQMCGIIEDDLDMDEDEDMDAPLYECLYYYYLHFMPRRSFDTTFIYAVPNIPEVTIKLNVLRSKPQPAQRTPEWYAYRREVITASNLYKIFGSQALQNELIYEKCLPIVEWDVSTSDDVVKSEVNTTSPLHWGVKYEPLSIMVYEDVYSTTIEQFGCITHDVYSFIGASPDGINSNPSSPRYGRLIEIKNVKSREIDGTICEQYWVQIQTQLEVCNINECDFLETKFVEYESYNDYLEDTGPSSEEIEEDEDYMGFFYKGLILYFHKPLEGPTYVYKPLRLKSVEEETQWENEMMVEYETKGYQWITNVYWKLEVFNCQLVLRNQFWFAKALPHISRMWDIIKYDRINGSCHRKPASRTKKTLQLK